MSTYRLTKFSTKFSTVVRVADVIGTVHGQMVWIVDHGHGVDGPWRACKSSDANLVQLYMLHQCTMVCTVVTVSSPGLKPLSGLKLCLINHIDFRSKLQ